LRDETAELLRARVVAMNLDNFVVRPQRQFVEKYVKPEVWKQLSDDDHAELGHRVAGLPSQQADEDEEAKRFDMLVLRTQLSILQAKPDFAGLRQKIQAIASALEDQSAIPAIKAEIMLISAVAGDEWWDDVTVPMLETVRRRLRALVKLIPKGQKKVVYTDFEDELGETTTIDLPQVTAGLNMSKFREKARQFLKEHESHLSLQRLRRNQPLTAADLVELERMLVEAGGTKALIDEAKEKSEGLGLFIRSLVGLDREAAMQAFSEFLKGSTATPDQIEFIELVVQELTLNGVMEADRLFQSPFTDISSQGPLGVFPPAKVSQPGVLAAGQRVVGCPQVGVVHRQPDPGAEEQRQLGVQRRESIDAGVEAAEGTHRAHQQGRGAVGVEHHQRQCHGLGPHHQGQQRGHQVGAAFQLDLPPRAAGQVPVAQQRGGKARRPQQRGRAQPGGQQQGQHRRVQHHGAAPPPSSTRPSAICTTRSTTAAPVMRGSWLLRISVLPRALSVATMARNCCVNAPSRLAVGSSAMTMAGSLISARAMAVRCISPPDSSSTRVASRAARPSSASTARARPTSSAWGGPIG
jgi:hypothetical protein